MSALSNIVTPCSRQISTSRVASAASLEPQPARPPLPPNVPVPKLSTGTLRPERPNWRYSMCVFPRLLSRKDRSLGATFQPRLRRGYCSDFRYRLFQPPADTHRIDAGGEAFGVGFHEHAAKRRRARRGREAIARQFAREAIERFELVHANNGIVIRAGARIGLIRRAAGKNLRVRRRHMLMRADNQTRAAVAEMAHRHFLRCRFCVHVHHDGVGALAERAGIEFGIHRGERIVLRFHEHAAERADDQNVLAAARLRPKPPAAFSPFTMTKSSFKDSIRRGSSAERTSRPGFPMISPMNRMRISVS